MRKFIVFLVVAMVGVGVPAVTVGATSSTEVITSCGQVVTTDAVLRTDLVCSGDGVMVEASGVTVRLNGHTITSTDGTGSGIDLGVRGLYSLGTHDICVNNVAVHGGTVVGFLVGVALACYMGVGDSVAGMRLMNNRWGLSINFGITLGVDRTSIVGSNGVVGSVHMTHSMIDATGYAWTASQTASSSIEGSRIEGGTIEPAENGDLGLSNSRLTGVTVACGDANISVSNSDLIASPVIRPYVDCDQTFRNDRFIGPGSGVGVALGNNNWKFPAAVTDSVFTGWGTAVELTTDSAGALLTNNTFRDNGTGVAGCTVWACGATVTGNRFLDNAGTGLSTRGGVWTIGSNTALRNGGLGIDAEAGPPPPYGPAFSVTDLGGNVARHNQAPQCIGVVCTP